jgi:hypothetical protein
MLLAVVYVCMRVYFYMLSDIDAVPDTMLQHSLHVCGEKSAVPDAIITSLLDASCLLAAASMY